MFKTSFSKYLLAFTSIILISFLMLSGIITSIISSYLTDGKEDSLKKAVEVVSEPIEEQKWIDLAVFANSNSADMLVTSVKNFNSDFDILITLTDGTILLSTIEADMRPENTQGAKVNFSNFSDGEDGFLYFKGRLDEIYKPPALIIAHLLTIENKPVGYVVALASTAEEDQLVTLSRRAVFNSSIWVMLAAVIATYFITERIIHPLRIMKGAAKSFAKGDFSTRITVYGKDEVSELAVAFNNMAESLESLEKMRNSFLANVSHDLRTPMTTISGFIDGITSGAIPPEKHDYYLGVISAEVHRLSRLVSQLLDVSRLESGDRKFTFTDFDVAEVARLILISFEQKIEDKRLDVSFESENDVMAVNADKDAIYQVIYNLCHNAIKFARDGGRLSIKLEKTQDKKIEISVYDDGQIVAPDELNMIFDRFYKTDKSRGLDKTGVGLGLYICRTIIEAHGEHISAISKDEGTEFVFSLKASDTLPRRENS